MPSTSILEYPGIRRSNIGQQGDPSSSHRRLWKIDLFEDLTAKAQGQGASNLAVQSGENAITVIHVGAKLTFVSLCFKFVIALNISEWLSLAPIRPLVTTRPGAVEDFCDGEGYRTLRLVSRHLRFQDPTLLTCVSLFRTGPPPKINGSGILIRSTRPIRSTSSISSRLGRVEWESTLRLLIQVS
jgi:hypothetical protein